MNSCSPAGYSDFEASIPSVKAVQAIERADDWVELLTDAELMVIAAGGLPEALSETRFPKICAPVGD